MSYKQRSGWKQPAQPPPEAPQQREYQRQTPQEPTFVIKQSQKTGTPFAQISGRVAPVGRSGANIMIFPSKFQGQFAALLLSGWGRNAMVPVSGDQIDIEGDTLKIDLGFIKIEVTGKNASELIEFLKYVSEMPRQAGGFQEGPTSQAAPTQPKASWKK